MVNGKESVPLMLEGMNPKSDYSCQFSVTILCMHAWLEILWDADEKLMGFVEKMVSHPTQRSNALYHNGWL